MLNSWKHLQKVETIAGYGAGKLVVLVCLKVRDSSHQSEFKIMIFSIPNFTFIAYCGSIVGKLLQYMIECVSCVVEHSWKTPLRSSTGQLITWRTHKENGPGPHCLNQSLDVFQSESPRWSVSLDPLPWQIPFELLFLLLSLTCFYST